MKWGIDNVVIIKLNCKLIVFMDFSKIKVRKYEFIIDFLVLFRGGVIISC